MPRHHADRVKPGRRGSAGRRHSAGFTLPLASHTLGEVVEVSQAFLRLFSG
jgi:hypothetical protein